MKNSFKVGDKIRGLKGNKYNITNEEMELAEVVYIYKNTGEMKIKILKHKSWKGSTKFNVDNSSKEFELIETKAFTKKDLKVGDIITLRNGRKGEYEGKETYIDCLEYENIENDLTNNGLRGTDLDIVKVERITATEVVFERTEETSEILDEAERKYLSSVIKPFKEKVAFIEKRKYKGGKREDLVISLNAFGCFYFPDFEKGSMYKGMEADKRYSLEELGL